MKVDTAAKLFQFLEKKEGKTSPRILNILTDPDPFPGFKRLSSTLFIKEEESNPDLNRDVESIKQEIDSIYPVKQVSKVVRRKIQGPQAFINDQEVVKIVTNKTATFLKTTPISYVLEGTNVVPVEINIPFRKSLLAFACKVHLGSDIEAGNRWRPISILDGPKRFAYVRRGNIKRFFNHKVLNTLEEMYKFVETLTQEGVIGVTTFSQTVRLNTFNLVTLQDKFENTVKIAISLEGIEYISINGQSLNPRIRITHNILRTYLKGYTPTPPKERTGPLKASQIVRDPSSPEVSFTYGRISRSGRGKEGTWSEIAPHLTTTTYDNIENVGKKLGIKWEKAYIYNLKDEAMVAVFGKDKKGREFMFDKYGAGQAGQTELRLGTKKIQVSKVLARKDSPFEEN